MTTTQAAPNGHHPLPPPLPGENRAQQIPPDVPATKEKSLGYSYPSRLNTDTTPLPDRCQFFFSGGRQCRMLRSETHPNLCPFHASREEELFNPPTHAWPKVNTRLDLPELYCASEDLGTATGVNRALAHVFRLLALRRITRQEAATFGHLAQLLLRTISAMRAEAADATSIGVPSEESERGTHLPYQPAASHGPGRAEADRARSSAANEPSSAAHCECAPEPQSHMPPATAEAAGSAPNLLLCPCGQHPVRVAPSSATTERVAGEHLSSSPRAGRTVPDFGSMLSASRTALASTAPHTEVPPNHPLIENVRQLPENQHLQTRGT